MKLAGNPAQLLATGVTLTLATCTVLPLLITLKAAIFPLPLEAKPILALLFVQLYEVLLTADPENTKPTVD